MSISTTADVVTAPHRPRRKTVSVKGRGRRATAGDAEVGRRVRSRRLDRGLSQTDLANQIGVTFQQVQKYEKGVNRIGADRLNRIAEALHVPVSFFFGDGSATQIPKGTGPDAPIVASTFDLLQNSGAIRLLKCYQDIKSRRVRVALVELAESMRSSLE